IFAALFDPFDRPPQLAREIGGERLLLVSGNLGAERPAYVGLDHADAVFIHANDVRDEGAQWMRTLRRGPHRELVTESVVACGVTARFHRRGHIALSRKTSAD